MAKPAWCLACESMAGVAGDAIVEYVLVSVFEVLEQGFHKKALRVATLVGKRPPPETVIPKSRKPTGSSTLDQGSDCSKAPEWHRTYGTEPNGAAGLQVSLATPRSAAESCRRHDLGRAVPLRQNEKGASAPCTPRFLTLRAIRDSLGSKCTAPGVQAACAERAAQRPCAPGSRQEDPGTT